MNNEGKGGLGYLIYWEIKARGVDLIKVEGGGGALHLSF